MLHSENPKLLLIVTCIGSTLCPYYNQICFLDYRLYIISGGDRARKRWWEHRISISSNSRIGSDAKLTVSKLLDMICLLVGCSNDEYTINDNPFAQVFVATVFDQIEESRFHQSHTRISQRNNNYNAEENNYRTSALVVNTLWIVENVNKTWDVNMVFIDHQT